MPRKLSILLLLVVCVLVVAWLRRTGGQDAVAVPKSDAAPPGDSRPVDLSAVPNSEIRRAEVAPEPSSHALSLRGSVTVTGTDGDDRNGKGTFTLSYLRHQSWASLEVKVVGGAWSTALDAPEVPSIVVSQLRIDGKEAFQDFGRDMYQVTSGVPVEITAHWCAQILLNVLDRQSRQHLTSLTLRRDSDYGADWALMREKNSQEVFRSVDSPFVLPCQGSLVTYYLLADGYSPTTAVVDPSASGQRTVFMEKACSLEVAITGHHPERGDGTLDVREIHGGVEGQSIRYEPASIGSTVLNGIPEGTYSVSLSYAHTRSCEPSAETRNVELTPTHPTSISFDQDAAPLLVESVRFPLAGTVCFRLDAGLPKEPVLSIAAIEKGLPSSSVWNAEFHQDGRQEAGDEAVLPWSAGEVPSGDYLLTVKQAEYSFIAHVGPGSGSQVELRISEPAVVTVTARDAVTGASVRLASLEWAAMTAGGIPTSTGIEPLAFDEAVHGFVLRTRAENAVFLSGDRSYALTTDELHPLGHGKCSVELAVSKIVPLRIVCMEGQVKVPMPMSWWSEVKIVDEAGREVVVPGQTLSGDSVQTLKVPADARHSIVFPSVPGFQPIGAARLDLGAGVPSEYVVQLTPL